MELRQLRYFLGVADCKSFSRAAAAVRVAQPALSRQIRKLEEEIGVALFYRDGRGAILTEQGEHYYRKISDILRQLDQAGADLRTDNAMPTGEVMLGVPPPLAPRFVSQIVLAFRSRYPSARIRVADGCNFQIAEWLQSSRIDIGFVYDPQNYQNLPSKTILDEALFLVGPHASRHTARETISFALMVKLPLILPNSGSTLRQRVARTAAELGLPVKYEMDIDSLPSIKQLVIDGVGYSILPYAAFHDEIQRNLLSAARIVQPDLYRPLGLAVRPNGPLSIATNKLSRLIQVELETFLAKGNLIGRLAAKSQPPNAVIDATATTTTPAQPKRPLSRLAAAS